MADDPDDGAIREGEPPYSSNASRRGDTPPKDGAEPSSDDWIGGASLFCAGVAWLGSCLVFLGDTGRLTTETWSLERLLAEASRM